MRDVAHNVHLRSLSLTSDVEVGPSWLFFRDLPETFFAAPAPVQVVLAVICAPPVCTAGTCVLCHNVYAPFMDIAILCFPSLTSGLPAPMFASSVVAAGHDSLSKTSDSCSCRASAGCLAKMVVSWSLGVTYRMVLQPTHMEHEDLFCPVLAGTLEQLPSLTHLALLTSSRLNYDIDDDRLGEVIIKALLQSSHEMGS